MLEETDAAERLPAERLSAAEVQRRAAGDARGDRIAAREDLVRVAAAAAEVQRRAAERLAEQLREAAAQQRRDKAALSALQNRDARGDRIFLHIRRRKDLQRRLCAGKHGVRYTQIHKPHITSTFSYMITYLQTFFSNYFSKQGAGGNAAGA